MKHLVIFSIGPVQDFINTARRSRDLWYGSWMLSELARFVAREIVKNKNNKLIFPADADIESIPNKTVAVVETDKPEVFAKDIVNKVKQHLVETLASPTFKLIEDKIKENKSNPINRTLADSQIKDLPELYWVSVPYNDRTYDVVREQAEAMLIARKNTRDFNQMTGGNVPKSSLDGSRESVIDENEYPPKRPQTNVIKEIEKWEKLRDDKVKKLYDNYNARQGERLSGVDLLKRLGEKNKKDEKEENIQPDFKSTSHMAAIPFLEKIVKRNGVGADKKLLDEIISVLPRNFKDIDKTKEVLVFESRLTDWVSDKTQLADLQKKIKDILDKEEYTDKKFSPNPYYALLRADGDYMGKVINGQKDEDKHRELSEALSKFASEVKKIVNEDHNGLLIYSGGDDVLAYLPINQALSCAFSLEGKFKNALGNFFAKDGTTSPTLSVGIVIAHHLDPLSDVLKLAKDAEDKAKEKVTGKNGLAVTLSKRSGTDRTVVAKFSDLYERLTELKKLFDSTLISGGTAYELQELDRTLSGTTIPPEGIVKEALRIIKHKKETSGGDLSDKVKDTFKTWIEKTSLDELTNEMIIAKSLADGAKPSTNQEQEAEHES